MFVQPLDGQGEGPQGSAGPCGPPKVTWQVCQALGTVLGPTGPNPVAKS